MTTTASGHIIEATKGQLGNFANKEIIKMNTLKDYSNKEISQLVETYNGHVKFEYAIDKKGMEYLLAMEVNEEDATEPYHEISSNQTKSGHPVIMEFDWA